MRPDAEQVSRLVDGHRWRGRPVPTWRLDGMVGVGGLLSTGDDMLTFLPSVKLLHNGGTGGFRTFAGFSAERGHAVVLLTNSFNLRGPILAGMRLLERLGASQRDGPTRQT